MKARPYTRKSSVKSKSYIKAVPPQKITKFKMGDMHGYEEGKLKYIVKVVADGKVMIRDNAIEAARQFIHKILDEHYNGLYYFEVKVAPHHILRENKMLTGAGADRMQTRMQLSFGATIGRAAQLKAGQPIFLIALTSDKARRVTAHACMQTKAKFPGHIRLEMVDLK